MRQAVIYLWIMGTLFGSAGLATAQPGSGDPVSALRQSLKTAPTDPADREKTLRQALLPLRGVGDLRRALVLQEWRDADGESAIAAVDLPLKRELQNRFEQAVREVFAHGDPTSQVTVADMIAELGVSSCAVGSRASLSSVFTRDLLILMGQQTPSVREAATRTLGQIHPDLNIALPALASQLQVEDEAYRRAAAGSLASLVKVAGKVASRSHLPGSVDGGPADLTAVSCKVLPLAAKAAGDSSAQVRRRGVEALGWSVSSVGALILERGTVDEATGEDATTEIEPLLNALRDQGPALARALKDPDTQVRSLARRTLEMAGELRVRFQKQMPPPSSDPLGALLIATLPALSDGVSDPDWHARQITINILDMLGPAAAPAAPALVGALNDPNSFVRWAAARAVAKLAPQSADTAVPALTTLLGDADLDLLLASASALEQYGPAALPAAPTLAQLVHAGRAADARLAGIHALEHMGPRAAETSVPTFVNALTDPDARVREAAALALGKLGTTARAGSDALRRARTDPSPEVRKAADDALLRLVTAE